MEGSYSLSTYHLRIRKLSSGVYLEIWENFNINFSDILFLQLPLSHYNYSIEDDDIIISRKHNI